MSKILVLTALPDELDKSRAPDAFEVIFTGVGKVNATSAATMAILSLRPSLVINYGTAGKINSALRGLYEVADVVQRDMMAMPLAPRGRTPFSPELDRLSSGNEGVVCGTGDSFVTMTDPWLVENKIDLVDMELFAIAHVCARHSVPWRGFKFITDDANDFAAEHWTANVADGQTLFWDAVKALG
jgi:adenosylhomocysteine nucleosidase